jgi:putative membrane protein
MGPRDLSHHSKLPMMLRIHGSITPKLVIPILLVSGWATAVTCISKLLYDRKLFLSSFDMFLPGLTLRSRDRSSFHYRAGLRCESSTQRPQFHLHGPILPRPTTLGRLRLASHTLARLVWIHVEERHGFDTGLGKQDLLGKVSCLNLIVAFAVALKHKLRFEPGTHYEDLKHLVGHLDTFAQAANTPAPDPPSVFRRACQLLGIPMATPSPRRHVKKSPIPLGDLPLEILSHLSAYIKVLNDTRTLRDYSIYQTQSLDSLTIMDEVSCGTERILNTPLPLAYSIAIAQVTWLYILLLPFQCFNGLGWINIPACIVAAYIILGIAFIGHEIEDPFGHDVNDLPLDAFCQQIRQDVDIIMSRAALLANDFMGREENMPLYPLSYLRTRAWADKSPEEIHVALSQIIALHYPMVEHGENSPPPAQGRLGGVERWTEKGAPGPNETTGNYRKKYGSV